MEVGEERSGGGPPDLKSQNCSGMTRGSMQVTVGSEQVRTFELKINEDYRLMKVRFSVGRVSLSVGGGV